MAMIVTKSKPIEFRVTVDMSLHDARAYVKTWSICLTMVMNRLPRTSEKSSATIECQYEVATVFDDTYIVITRTTPDGPTSTELAIFSFRSLGNGYQTQINVSCKSAYTPQLLSGFLELIHDLPLSTELARIVDIYNRSTQGVASRTRGRATQMSGNSSKHAGGRRVQKRTLHNLMQLADLREDSIHNGYVSVTFSGACRTIGIDTETVHYHCPWMRSAWDQNSITYEEFMSRIQALSVPTEENSQ